MKRRAVRLTSPLPGDSILEALQSAAEAESAVENMLFELDALESVDLPALDFRGCLFRRVQFSDLRARRTFFTNCRFESCDFAGQTFRDGTVSRAEFVGCRGAGATFEKMKLRDVLFRDCRLSDATLAECDLGRVDLADCDLSRSMLYECAQKEIVLEKCNLTEAEFSGTSDGRRGSLRLHPRRPHCPWRTAARRDGEHGSGSAVDGAVRHFGENLSFRARICINSRVVV